MKKKKIFFIFFLIFLITTNILADEIAIYVGNGYNYNEILGSMVDTHFAIKYDTEKDQYYFYTYDFMTKGWVFLTNKDLEKLRNILTKYKKWEKTAIENEVEIEKEFPNSQISGKVVWKSADEWFSASNITIHFSFFSQNKYRHQLVIFSNKVNAFSNEFMVFKIEPIYMDKNQVEDFLHGISSDSINIKLKEYSEKKKKEELFQ